jgi:NADH:ubiquinone oxidoreductase subunit 4 (subunit M)
MLYVITWLPKVALLVIVITLFVSEFYIIFSIMQLYNHGLAIQIIGMVLTFAGLIILMRKGYLSLLKKYNLTKLKSPLEHAEIGILLLIDLVGLVLWVINMALIINIGRSWDY